MSWNKSKCPAGGPDPFDPMTALNAAKFSSSYFVQDHDSGKTRSAYTFLYSPVWRIVVVGHIHWDSTGKAVAGNCYIPGWEGWEVKTPAQHVAAIADLKPTGSFRDDRYPVRKSVSV